MQAIYVFLDIANVADFQWKNADAAEPKGLSRDFYICWIFRQGITVPGFIIVGYVWQIFGSLLAPRKSVSSPKKANSEWG